MFTHNRAPNRHLPVGRMGVSLVGTVAWLLAGATAHASTLSAELQQLTQGQRFERRISLSTMGVMGPSVNIPADSLQEFYFPAQGGERVRSALVVTTPANQPAPAFAVNGMAAPARAAAPGLPQQVIHTHLPVNGSATPARLGMQVGPQAPTTCDAKSTGAVALNPDSYLSYYATGVDTSVASVASTWSQAIATMPERPFLLVAAPPLSRETFDTAWRVGLAMARQGRPVTVHTLPSVGDIVDTRALSIPAALESIAAFAALKDASEHHALANAAEIGALLMLDAGSLLADVVVVDPLLQSQLARALDALQLQITDEDALDVFQQWRDKRMPLARVGARPTALARMAFGAHPAWTVTADGASSIASLDTQAQWRALTAVADGAARLAASQANHALLRDSSSAKAPHQFTVQAPQNWAASFALTPPLATGHTPSHIQVHFQLPESAAQQGPVGVLHWNGILLAARNLKGNGERETLAADIPVYALSAINVLQIAVKQNAPAGGCRPSTPVPTTALQLDVRFDSAVAAGTAPPTHTPSFADVISSLGRSADIAVPQSYLTQARLGLANTIQLAAAANLSPIASRLVLVDARKAFAPSQSFVALDVALPDTPHALALQDQQIALRDRPVKGLPWPPASGVTAVQVVRTDQQNGLLWYPLGAETRVRPTGLLVNHGQLALLGPGSEVAWINASGSVVRAADANTAGTMYEWRSLFSWGVPVTLASLSLFIVLLMAAAIAARRAKRKSQAIEGVA